MTEKTRCPAWAGWSRGAGRTETPVNVHPKRGWFHRGFWVGDGPNGLHSGRTLTGSSSVP